MRQRAREAATSQPQDGERGRENGKRGTSSRANSRAPSPTSSHGHGFGHGHGHGPSSFARAHGRSSTAASSGSTYHANGSSISLAAPAGNGGNSGGFSSPLYKPQRAPLLRVFVPSPDGDWLSDESVLGCETELDRAGVTALLRTGDVVWDVAVGEEGNVGRLVWDGRYLVDLDFRFNRAGELPPYFHSLGFAPSYFHRVIRGSGNPVVHVDVSPWGSEIAANLQLIQDRARTETQHGASHNVVRWVHRSSFVLRPPPRPAAPSDLSTPSARPRLPIPGVEGAFVDPGWHGTVVLEAEGTNEGLADLQDRCGPRAFPPRAESVAERMRGERAKGCRKVWRVLRERSRPGEIWLKAVTDKERLM
ncbi:hypothetical protein CONPUDRAFT_65536 [Coniophora puteana RWD-64-598 SS2]|uniref:Uncharacterized protein n=1 Tax=Coniophora puteana (strain RWD-64-598) TaxID=741705 RepID=A0A5M3M9J8_CONPW|nr:uncharacterized protein CONPUDRAFT_65536 [Coniophora puteana RWD-64-598 SS2]EIW75534.1 hypothetical protein CONPUDRAFT_65536 [Coniophora puteana RWD-64-598 SS2]